MCLHIHSLDRPPKFFLKKIIANFGFVPLKWSAQHIQNSHTLHFYPWYTDSVKRITLYSMTDSNTGAHCWKLISSYCSSTNLKVRTTIRYTVWSQPKFDVEVEEASTVIKKLTLNCWTYNSIFSKWKESFCVQKIGKEYRLFSLLNFPRAAIWIFMTSNGCRYC